MNGWKGPGTRRCKGTAKSHCYSNYLKSKTFYRHHLRSFGVIWARPLLCCYFELSPPRHHTCPIGANSKRLSWGGIQDLWRTMVVNFVNTNAVHKSAGATSYVKQQSVLPFLPQVRSIKALWVMDEPWASNSPGSITGAGGAFKSWTKLTCPESQWHQIKQFARRTELAWACYMLLRIPHFTPVKLRVVFVNMGLRRATSLGVWRKYRPRRESRTKVHTKRVIIWFAASTILIEIKFYIARWPGQKFAGMKT